MSKSTFYEIRRAAGQAGSTCPVKTIEGDAGPELTGDGWHYRNRSGDYIRYPSAYAKKGWSSLVYHPSTHCILVGRDWVSQKAPEVFGRIMINRLKAQ